MRSLQTSKRPVRRRSTLIELPIPAILGTALFAVAVCALSVAVSAADSDDISIQPLAVRQLGGTLECDLQLGDRTESLLLTAANVRAPGFRVRVQRGDGTIVDHPLAKIAAPAIWTGRVAGHPDSRVTARYHDGELSATVFIPHRNDPATWEIKPAREFDADAARSTCAVYRSEKSADNLATCALDGDLAASSFSVDPVPATTSDPTKDITLDVQICELACDTDAEFFTQNGSSVAATVADIELVVAAMATIYERDVRLTLQITDILVRETEPDPYTATDPYVLLDELTEEWRDNQQHIDRDVVQFFTGKDLAGTPIGIAWSGRYVCSEYAGYSLVQSHFSEDLGERAAVSAHELGHNIDLGHCDYGDWWCRIMCSNMNGCSGGIHSFGNSSLQRLHDEIPGLGCLSPSSVIHATTTLPFLDEFTSGGVPHEPDPALWLATDLAQIIYGRLELETGDTYGVNELGTVRTLPMTLTGAANLTFKARSSGLPAGQPLRVQYFETSTWQWIDLLTVTSTGGSSNPLVEHSAAIPATAAGDYFSVRLSADGNGGDWNDEWHLDDVLIEASVSGVGGDLPDPALLITSIVPNPFNPSTRITFAVPFEGRAVTLDVLNLQGDRVCRLVDRWYDSGEQTAVWHGLDDSGRRVASGVYFAVLESQAGRTVQKMALIK